MSEGKATLFVQVDPALKESLKVLAHQNYTDVAKLVRQYLEERVQVEMQGKCKEIAS